METCQFVAPTFSTRMNAGSPIRVPSLSALRLRSRYELERDGNVNSNTGRSAIIFSGEHGERRTVVLDQKGRRAQLTDIIDSALELLVIEEDVKEGF